jgi:hypothetical protein
MSYVLAYPTALVDAPIVRGLITKQCEMLRAMQIRPEFAGILHTSEREVEQTIAAHQLALRYLKEVPCTRITRTRWWLRT